ncbi:hypothetical protein DM992_21680 [Burkholderia sp. JP2-270]|nr:hypothetical protein DM992_21680 [Burkholderia sp. JP2-270]
MKGANENEKPLRRLRSGLRVFICFSYYAGNGLDDKLMTHDRVGIFKVESKSFRRSRRMRVAGTSEAAARACRTGRRTLRFPFVRALEAGRTCRDARFASEKNGSSGRCVTARFSSLKHSFTWPSGEGWRAGFVRQIVVLLRDAQRSARVPDCCRDTFLKHKVTFPAIRAGAAAVRRSQ